MLAALDGTGSTVRIALLDYRKAFELVDHNLLVSKLFNFEIKPTVINWIADFLRGRTQTVKINSVLSSFLQVPAGIPQGTKIGPWLFLAIINDLRISNSTTSELWKFADDTSVSEVIPKTGVSSQPDTVNEVHKWSNYKTFQFNLGKCKERRINFTTQPYMDDPLNINGETFDIVESANVLGMRLTSDRKWNKHVSNVVEKPSKRLYLLKQLKRAEVKTSSLYKFYTACIRSVVEYACQVFHSSLPNYLSSEIENVQKRALRIIHPDLTYIEAINQGKLETLYERREMLCIKLFSSIEANNDHKLKELMLPKKSVIINLRTNSEYELPKMRTNRFSNSFIPYCARKATQIVDRF